MTSNIFISSRRAAFKLLKNVYIYKKSLSDFENNILNSVQEKDRGLVRMIVYTSLRHNGELDYLISKFCKKEPPKEISIYLKIGIVQIIWMNVKEHAAVSEVLKIVEKSHQNYKGLINAVLRKFKKDSISFLKDFDISLNYPKFIWDGMVRNYGEKVSRNIISRLNDDAETHLNIKDLSKFPEELNELLNNSKVDEKARIGSDIMTCNAYKWANLFDGDVLPVNAIKLPKNSFVTKLKGFYEGSWWVQNLSAQIPVSLIGDVEGKEVLDMCSAPGGKTAQLVKLGANVTALDNSPKRIKKLEENLERLSIKDKVNVVCGDARKINLNKKFDAILIDAPCSATGIINRNPDISFLKSKNDIKKLAKVQNEIIFNSIRMLKNSGCLIFATCSMQPEEGEQHLKNIPKSLKIDPIRRKEIKDLEIFLTTKGVIKTYPANNKLSGADGFFIARFIKKPN